MGLVPVISLSFVLSGGKQLSELGCLPACSSTGNGPISMVSHADWLGCGSSAAQCPGQLLLLFCHLLYVCVYVYYIYIVIFFIFVIEFHTVALDGL